MATYTLTSPQTGREYDVEFDREPTQADVDGIWPQLDAHYATQEENKNVLFGVDTLSGIGQALGGLPTTANAAYYRMLEGDRRPDEYSPEARAAFDAANAYQARMQQESQDRIMRGEATSAGEAFREAAPSLGTSAISMGANIGGRLVGKGVGAVAGLIAGAPSGPAAVGTAGVGGALGETAAGMAASYYVTQRIAKSQFLDDAFRLLGEERAQKGQPWGEQEKQEAYQELLPLAEAAARWEAAPEALSNAITFGAGKYVLGIGKKTATDIARNVWKTLGKKTGAAVGSLAAEGATETVTQLGQAPLQAQAQAYAQGRPGWQQEQGPYARPGGTLQAAADVLPATVATQVLMLGMGAGVKGGASLLTSRRDAAATPAPGQPMSQTGQPMSQPSPLAGIAARGGRVDVPPLLPEDTGDFTAAEARALAPRQPILTNVPDRAPDNAPVSTQPPADQTAPDAVPTPPQTLTGSNVQTGTEMPVPPPTAAAGAGAGGISTPASPTPSTLATTTAPAPAATPETGGVAESSAAVSPSETLTAAPAAVQPGELVTYEGYAGRLTQDGQRLTVETPEGTLVDVADPAGLTRLTDPAVRQRVTLGEMQRSARGVTVSEATFTPAAQGTTPALQDARGRTYVPHNPRLLRSVRQGPNGLEVLVRDTAEPGRIIKLVGPQALQAQDALIAAAAQVEAAGGKVNWGTQRAPGLTNFKTNGRMGGFLNSEILAEGEALIRNGVTAFTQWSAAMVRKFGEAIREFLVSIWQQVKPMAADALMNYMQRSGSIKMLSETGEMPRRVNVQNGKVQNMTTSAIDVLYQDSVALPKPTSKTSNDTVAKNLQEAAMEQWGRVITSEDIQPEEEAMIVANGVDEVLAGWGASGKTAADWYTTNVEAAMAVAEVIHDELSSDAAAQRVRVNGRQVFRNREDAKLAMYLAMAITSQNLNVNQNTTYAEEQFNLFKRNGEFDSSKVYGDKAKSISANLALANLLIRKLGWEEMYETVKADYTVKALSDLASKVTGRKVSIAGRQNDIVQGAALFGPKIGQGFLQNLMGNFYPVTIDLWMRRTWGRWTGDVLGDGITGERLAKLIDEARRIGLMLPASLARTRPVVRRTEKGKPFRTMSEDFIDRVENEEDLRDEINNYTKEVVAIWTRKYNAVQSGITQAQRASLLNGSVTMDSVADVSLRDEERLNRRWEALKNKPKGKGAKEAWKQQQRQAHGRTQVLTTDEWNGTVNGVKNAGRKLKPKWALAANVIRSQLKPLDSPSDQDRMVISRIVNKIRVELESRGVKVSNADIQAILWYPEKDLWAKLRGEQESDLKQSYEEEFVRIANQRGRGREAAEAVARVRAARAGRSNDASANGRVRNGAQAAAVEKGFRNLDASGRTGGFLNSEILAEGEALIRNGVTAFTQWSAAMVRKFGEAIREFLVSIWQQVKPLVADALMNYMQRTGSLKTVVQTNGMPQGTAPVTVGEGGFVGTGSPGAEGANLTQARFAPPNEADQVISSRRDVDVLAEAQAWLAGRSALDAVAALEAGTVALAGDAKQRAMGVLINRLSQTMMQGDEAQQTVTRTLLERMSRLWVAESNSADVARELRQRAVANNADLAPVSPILATLQMLVDRGKKVLSTRFTGGEVALTRTIQAIGAAAGRATGTSALNDKRLQQMLDALRKKIAPGMTWTEIFTDMPEAQKARQREIYRRLMLDERLAGLTLDERVALTNELDKAWQRERRTVFQRELQKAGVLGEKKASDRQKVVNGLPKLLRLMNLGVLSADTVREVIAAEYGLRSLSAADVKRLRDMGNAAYELPEGSRRNRALKTMMQEMQALTGATWTELLSNYWTASVLSGLRTQFDTFLSVLNGLGANLMQAGTLLARGQGRSAVEAHAQWWRYLASGALESMQILAKGDTTYLKQFGDAMQEALKGERTSPIPAGEMLWRNGNVWQKYFMAPVMIFTGRLMAAADHLNNTATTGGALAVARALNPELYAGRAGFTAAERAAARTQAILEVTGGTPPATMEERAQVSIRTRELLSATVEAQDVQAASEIGDMAAFQNDPTGVFGSIYSAVKQGLGSAQRKLGAVAEDEAVNRHTRALSLVLASTLHGITGTRFMRFGFNFGADITRYIPGTYLLGKAGFYGRNVSRMQQDLLLGKNLVGLMLGSTLATMFLSKEDEEDGWHIEGDWSTLTPQEQKQRMSAGLERMTMWKRENGQVSRVSYKQWPTMGLFAMVGRMLDEKRHKPDIWAQRGTAGHLGAAALTGMFQIQNVSAMQNLAQLFGQPTFAADPAAEWGERITKMFVNYPGGLVPTLVKDADIWADPRSYKPEGMMELMARNIPIARRFVNDGRPQLNQLGEEVKLQRAPWSRAYTTVESGDAHRVLGGLLARGLNLPAASDKAMITKDGVRMPIEALGGEAVWRYEKAVGEGYRAWLASPDGQALLTMPVQQAERVINYRAESIKRQAKAKVTRY